MTRLPRYLKRTAKTSQSSRKSSPNLRSETEAWEDLQHVLWIRLQHSDFRVPASDLIIITDFSNRNSETICSAPRRTTGLRIFRGLEKRILLLRLNSVTARLSQDFMTSTLSVTKTASTSFIFSTLKALTKSLSKKESLSTKKQLKRI